MTIGGIEERFLWNDSKDFIKYPVRGNKWALEVRGHTFQGKTTELSYKVNANIDSFSRGIQLPTKQFMDFAVQLKGIYKDVESFQCTHYKCQFFDQWCNEGGIKNMVGNFTLRFSDSYGYTISPQLFMIEGVYKVGDLRIKTCEV